MQVFLIDPKARTVSAVEVDDGLEGIRRLIGYDSVEADEVGDQGDRLWFDESCFIRAVPDAGRFRLDTLPPVAGRGVVTGSDTAGGIAPPALGLEALSARVRFD